MQPPAAYALDNTAFPETVDLLSEILDATTHHRLAPLTGAGARWLELGAGNGSVAGWIADRVIGSGAATGAVIAVDLTPERIAPHPGVVPLGVDLAAEPIPAGPFDGVHARLLLAHLPYREAVLATAIEELAPGGVVVVEEWGRHGQGRMLACPDPDGPRLYARYQDALLDVFAAAGNDPEWALGAHAAMREAGLVGVRTVAGPAVSWQGGSAGCRLPIAVSAELNDRLVAAGLTAGELDRLRALLAHPRTVVLGNTLYATIGYRPGGRGADGRA